MLAPSPDSVTQDPRSSRIPAKPLLSEMHGMAAARTWGEDLATAIADYRADKIDWSDVDPGCLLFGPPGTGKTLFATALAATCKLPLIKATFGDWQSAEQGYLGDCMKAMRETFELAAACAPCILHIDELDSLPARGHGERATYWNAMVNDVLKAIDRAADTPGIVIIGCCNNPSLLDPALVRAGRMDRQIEIGYPTVEEIPGILQFHLTVRETVNVVWSNNKSADTFSPIAQMAYGLSSAELVRLVRAVRSRARSRKAHNITFADFEAELDPLDGRPDSVLERRIAIHEAGHAVVGARLGIVSDFPLSIVPHAARGGTMRYAAETRTMTRENIFDRLAMMLAGRAAEEIFFGAPSAGAGGSDQSDLAQATRLARDAIAIHGLSASGSLYWYGDVSASVWPHTVRQEADALLAAAYESAKAMIAHDWDYVNETASALIKKRVLPFKAFRLIDRRPTDNSACNADEPILSCEQL